MDVAHPPASANQEPNPHPSARPTPIAIQEDGLARAAYGLLCREILLQATGWSSLTEATWLDTTMALVSRSLEQLAARVDRPPSAVTFDGDWLRADPLRQMYHVAVPARQRLRRGEVYTPAWLADHVIAELWTPDARWIDPCVGGGAFLLALARRSLAEHRPLPYLAGIDRQPLALLAAAANLAVAHRLVEGKPIGSKPLPLACADLLASPGVPLAAVPFDRVCGNPPWVSWERIASHERRTQRPLWEHYGLLAETGMASILGGGKKDLSMLVTYVAADRLLAPGGRLGFVITETVFKSVRSGRGFRRWRLPDGTPLGVDRVDDLTALQPFPAARTRTAVLFLEKGRPTTYPVRYHVWQDRRRRPRVALAEPASSSDPLSAWRHQNQTGSLPAIGPCAYRAHLGVNTGGANGVFWFERVAVLGNDLWRMRNLAHRSRSPIEPVEVDLEAAWLYPIVLGTALDAWQARPSAWILLVQDPERRCGVDPEALRQAAPRVYAYLQRFESVLRSRAAFRRFFQSKRRNGLRDRGPFYSMFDFGGYSLAPYKTAWPRIGKRMAAAVVGAIEGKPVQVQETHGFVGVDESREAHYLCALLNSRGAASAILQMSQIGGKSFATPAAIERLALPRFDPTDPLHLELAEFSLEAHRRKAAGEGVANVTALLDAAADACWQRRHRS